MVHLEEILSMAYLEKTSYTGSTEGMRYRLEKYMQKHTTDAGEEVEEKVLKCTIWPEPFNYHTTPDELKTVTFYAFDRDGVTDAVSWMNDQLFDRKAEFEAARTNWTSYHLPD